MASLPRMAGNAASLLTSDVVNRAATFALYALIARYLSAFELGQMSVALTLFYIAQVLAVAGLKTLITREVARDRASAPAYLLHAGLIVVATSLLSTLAISLFARAMGRSAETTAVVSWLSLALLPYSLSAICEGLFQAREEMRYIAYASLPVHLLRVAGAFLLLSSGYRLPEVVILVVLCHVALAAVEGWLVLRRVGGPWPSLDPGFALSMVKATGTFLGIDGLIALFGSLEILLLATLAGEAEVGLFSAAVQLLLPLTLLYQSVVTSVFPLMCRRFSAGHQSRRQIAEELIGLLLAVAMPTAIGLFFLAESALALLYGDELRPASTALRILVSALVLRALTIVLGHVLLASRRERVTLRIVVVDALASFTIGLALIGPLGVVGAATTALLTRLIDLYQHYRPVSRLLPGLALSRLGWHALAASAAMALYLAVAPDREALATVLLAASLYLGLLLGLTVWSAGGVGRLRASYAHLWSE
jgi:O-antigen/teichoic acid export membrane protein